MKYKCPKCGLVVYRDRRITLGKRLKSFCDTTGGYTMLVPVPVKKKGKKKK